MKIRNSVCECEGSLIHAMVLRGFVGDVQYGTCAYCDTDRPVDSLGKMLPHPRSVF